MSAQPPPAQTPPPGSRAGVIARLSSRKFLVAVGAAIAIITGWAKGALPPATAAAILAVLSAVYILAEAYVDAANSG